MIQGIEKNKLANLKEVITGIKAFNSEQTETLIQVYDQYSKILNKLYSKEANIFGNIRNHSFKETKQLRRELTKSETEEIRQESLLRFKDSLQQNIETSIDYLTEYVY